MTTVAHDEAARFVYTLAGPSRRYIDKADLEPFLQDMIETFPGLHFLREAKEFHSRYVQTVRSFEILAEMVVAGFICVLLAEYECHVNCCNGCCSQFRLSSPFPISSRPF
jgi:hypothetical protein